MATFYFDGHSGISDPDAVWTNDANAFDSDNISIASASALGSTSSNFLLGQGTTAPAAGFPIRLVQVRSYSFSFDYIVTINIYSAGLGELLGTVSVGGGTGFGAYVDLAAPTGGWTWQKVQDLEAKAFATGNTAAPRVSIIELAVFIDPPASGIYRLQGFQ